MLVPFEPPPGINSDDTTFAAQGRWAAGDGVRFYRGKAETVGGKVEMTAGGALVNVRKIMAYEVSGAVRIAAAGTLLTSNVPNGASNNITPASGWLTTSRYCLQMWGDNLLASCSGGKLFESAAGAQATEITQSPDVITCMIVAPTRQVFALGCNEEVSGTFNGRCLRFSNIGDNTDWTTLPSNMAGEHILPGQADIVSGCVLGDYIIIWTEAAIWYGQFAGNPEQPWVFTRVADIGIAGLDAFAVMHETVYWVAPDLRFHTYQVGGIVQEIPCPVSKAFVAACTSQANIHACTVTRYGEIWFNYPTLSAIEPTTFIVFCINESAAAQTPVWYTGTWPAYWSLGTALGNRCGAMIDNPLLLASSSTAETTVVAAPFLASGGGQKFRWIDCNNDTGPDSSSITSADQYIDSGGRRMMVRRLIPDFEYQGGDITLSIFTRDRPRSTPVDLVLTLTAASTKLDFRKSGMIMSAVFAFAAGALGYCRFGKPVFDIIPMGER